MNIQWQTVTSILLASTILIACTSDPNNPIIDDPSNTDTYLFYQGINGQIFAVDPTKSTDAITEITIASTSVDIGTGGIRTAYMVGGTFANDTLSDKHYPYLIFVNSDNLLYRIDTRLSNANLTPVQMTSTAFGDLCNVNIVPDYTNEANSLFLFRFNEGTGCVTPSAWQAVTMNATSSTTVIPATKVISGIYSTTGFPGSLLARNNGNLSLANLALTIFTTLSPTTPVNSPRKLSANHNGIIMLATDKDPGGEILGYNTDSGTLTNSGTTLYTLTAAWQDKVQDENNIYFDQGNDIIRVSKTGAGTATTVTSGIAGPVANIKLTDNYIVFKDNNGDLQRILKTVISGTPMLIETGIDSFFTNGSVILYNTSPTTKVANIIKEDGTGLTSFTGEATAPALGAEWINVELLTTHADDFSRAKGKNILVYESDSGATFYALEETATTLTGAESILTVPVTSVALMDADVHEGNYALLTINGAGGAIYVYDKSAKSSTRLDDMVNSSGDESSAVITP